MERMAWTDERIDDFVQEMRDFRRETREEFRAIRSEMASESGSVRAELVTLRTDMTRFGFGLAAALFIQLIAILLAIVFGT